MLIPVGSPALRCRRVSLTRLSDDFINVFQSNSALFVRLTFAEYSVPAVVRCGDDQRALTAPMSARRLYKEFSIDLGAI